jgi:NADH-quinone oxidoreductase subunit N
MLEPINIAFSELNFITIVPMIIAIVGALVIICIDLVKKDLGVGFYTMLSVLFLSIDFIILSGAGTTNSGFFELLKVDGLAVLAQGIIVLGSILFLPLALSKKTFHEYTHPEYFALYLFMVSGLQFMASSSNLIMIFIGLETASLSLYTLIALHNRKKALEASIKYFTMGALAAGFFVFGALIMYGLTGTLDLDTMSQTIKHREETPMVALMMAFVFMIASLGFKLALVPFQTWAPDVYEGSSSPMAGFISIVPKIAGIVVALRIFEFFYIADTMFAEEILYFFAVITMSASNIMALVQKDVKRMLAYSSISHAGFILAAIMIQTLEAGSAIFLYWILFTFLNAGAFALLWMANRKEKDDFNFENFSGFIKTNPIYAVIAGIFMLALAGIPPFAMFWGKITIIQSALEASFINLAIIMALNSAIAVFYYLKLIVFMFLKEPNKKTIKLSNGSISIYIIVGLTLFVSIFAMFFIDFYMSVIRDFV